MKIVFLGNSLTEGSYGGDFVAHVAKLLPQHEIINAGVGGDTILNLLERLDRDVLEHEPDGVFVMCAGNDAISYIYSDVRKYYRRSKDVPEGVVSPELYAQSYRELLTRLQLAHVQTWVGLSPTEYSKELLETVQHYNSLSAEAARALNIPILDLMPYFDAGEIPDRPPLSMDTIRLIGNREASGWNDYENEQQRLGYTYTFDGLHLTPKTAEKLAEIIVKFLNI